MIIMHLSLGGSSTDLLPSRMDGKSMLVQLSASPDGISASVLYGPNIQWGNRNAMSDRADQKDAAGGARIIDIQAQQASFSSSRDALDFSRQPIAQLTDDATDPLTYSIPRSLGQAPRLIASSPALGQHVDRCA
jgi:hypothetical protein